MAASEGQWRLRPRSALPPSRLAQKGASEWFGGVSPPSLTLSLLVAPMPKVSSILHPKESPVPFILGLWHLFLHLLCPDLPGPGLWCPCSYPQRKAGCSVVWCFLSLGGPGKQDLWALAGWGAGT